jgi:hypothetical protein
VITAKLNPQFLRSGFRLDSLANKAGLYILPFAADQAAKRTKSFCGESCTLYYISTQLSKLHKEENPKPFYRIRKELKGVH